MQRSKALQIYMKPGLREDDLMLRVWEASRRHARPQDVFRSMLRAGLRVMVESGELSDAVIEECGLDAIFEHRRLRAARRRQVPPDYAPPPGPMAQPVARPPAGYAPEYHPVYHHPVAQPVPVAPVVPPSPMPVVAAAARPEPQAEPRAAQKAEAAAVRASAPEPSPAKAERAVDDDKGPADGKRIGKLM